MSKKRIAIIALLFIAISFSLLYGVMGRNDAKMVFKVRPGFIPLEEVSSSSEGGMLRYVFWKARFHF